VLFVFGGCFPLLVGRLVLFFRANSASWNSFVDSLFLEELFCGGLGINAIGRVFVFIVWCGVLFFDSFWLAIRAFRGFVGYFLLDGFVCASEVSWGKTMDENAGILAATSSISKGGREQAWKRNPEGGELEQGIR